MLKDSWRQFSPKTQRWLAVGVAVTVLGALVYVVAPADPGSKRAQERKERETVRHVLTDTDTRKVSLDSLSAQIQLLQRGNEEAKHKIERLERELGDARKSTTDAIADQMKRLREAAERGPATTPAGARPAAATPNPFAQTPLADYPRPPRTTREAGAGGFEVRVIGEDAAAGDAIRLAGAERDSRDYDVYLPAGSILSAVLITGVDAPTGLAARREPFPIMARANKEAILPNDFRADVRECFMIVGTYGDLSSERVFGRGETLSCVRTDGKVIETKLEGFMSGSDGKNGLRGRLVSRSGTVIARAALAGFLEGMSKVFGYQPVPVIATTPAQSVQYQQNYSSDAVRAAAYGGAGKSFERLAEYYMKLTDAIQPVLEIDSGRQIDFILTGPLRMRLRDE
ncbi:conjugal transfer protein TraB [Sulfurifustis variabilis]|uniref:Conjugal transfer protein TraB n=1 Tax=Sulfurifustis variabilis TaxID=1675686 RepID=A0A1B4V7Y1_9GAMM|nr:TraB/VirB10 family protein [Sulfurifustis variabilis]BAU49639.1 conjugal transfer protein TraB [Sulfurifustis variabilis]